MSSETRRHTGRLGRRHYLSIQDLASEFRQPSSDKNWANLGASLPGTQGDNFVGPGTQFRRVPAHFNHLIEKIGIHATRSKSYGPVNCKLLNRT